MVHCYKKDQKIIFPEDADFCLSRPISIHEQDFRNFLSSGISKVQLVCISESPVYGRADKIVQLKKGTCLVEWEHGTP